MRIAACQMLTTPDVAVSLEKVLERLRQCAGMGAVIAAFPEGTLFGYCCEASYWETAEERTFTAAEAKIGAACRELGIAAVVGTAYRADGAWQNGLAIFDVDGRLKARYSKTFLAGEKWCGNNQGKLQVVTLAGVECCFLICHDIRYPELVRLPAAAGAKLCIYCSNESGLTQEHKLSAYRAMPIARATENDIFLMMANAPADARNPSSGTCSHGNSKIVDPDGNVMTEAGYFGDTIVSTEIDVTRAHARFARRSCEETTALRPWMRDGLKLVEHVG
jgi:predicted amidohydrolase